MESNCKSNNPLVCLSDKRNRKKKRKARKNQTMPGGGATELGGPNEERDEVDPEGLAGPRGWPTPAVRASRSPRLDTVSEPDNESGS